MTTSLSGPLTVTANREYGAFMSEAARTERVVTSVALVLAALGVMLAPLVDIIARDGVDGDDAGASLIYLAENGAAVVLSGLLLVLAGSATVVATTGMRRRLTSVGGSLAIDASAVAGAVAGACLALAGVLRISAPGPIGYISEIAESDGRAAYLVVQTIGSQLLFPAGTVALAAWVVTIAAVGWRRRSWPRAVAVVAIPAAVVILSLIGPLMPDLPDGAFVVRVAALLAGLPLAMIVLGVANLLTMQRQPAG